ncbi:MAG TPA: DUF924 family protein [Sphingomonas sp.]|uniref:DUF924 family protein n=1 Tax=Sphingomonas sp. TaxID=28214 RepID=UPI002B58F14D|nr:DUF924 family protein [Sphingomonas sp.]HMI18819.1 DUF924 family protein [Sphingomonas sp.]
MTASADGARAIIDFWFREVGPNGWWTHSTETDAAIRDRFLLLWEEWRSRPADHFLGTAGKALAAVVLFDQFSRNMFRGEGRAFATDPLALAIAQDAIDRGFDARLSPDERMFLYMPFQHSEYLAMQDRAVALFEALGRAEQIDYAHKHRDMIAHYGRFPARNAALGRPDRSGETKAIAASASW